MTEFSDIIKSWETFYLLVGTAAVTLIGLLAVSVFLIGSASQNAWVLLMRPGTEEKGHQKESSA